MGNKPIKFNPDLESEGGKLYKQYCEEKGIDCSITAAANFCLGYMAVKEAQTGAVWVKASEFKTIEPVFRPYRRKSIHEGVEYDYGEVYVTEDNGTIYLDIAYENNYDPQSDERWKYYEILDESAAGREDDAVEFAEWLYNNRWFQFENGKWYYTFEQGTAVSDKTYQKNYVKTTAELYTIFKQQKEK